MAIKKNELYSSLWASCDKLRGGMDASQYKDYILTLLFVKYVTDKFQGVKYADITVPEGGSFDDLVALKGNKNIGEEMDKVIAKLAEAGENNLRGVIDNAHFNDEAKLGSGKEMVDKLTGLIAIFQRDEFNFKKNKASGDDILGDAYEYLMRHFATESGKSKGQFYTPAEVSRILAKVIGIDSIEECDEGYSVYDPACGSGSLLIRAADEAPFEIAIWGQEKEVTTAGLAKMNLVLHNKAAGEIRAGNTFSAPRYFEEGSDDEVLKRFDFAVANPPFSLKNWTDGLKDYGRFDGYGDRPPEKNGDFAWLLHILKSLKSTGKAAVILPHGVLFRGNAEATIRKAIAAIVDAFYSDKYPLGRVKVQKLLYLLHRHQAVSVSDFKKKAAGPYADTVRYKGGEPIAKKNKYIVSENGKQGTRYSRGENMAQALSYVERWGMKSDLQWLKENFLHTGRNDLELFATVDMAMSDLAKVGISASVESIKDLIASSKEWKAKLSKTYFSDRDIARAIKKCTELFN